MLVVERRGQLLEAVRQRGVVTIQELADALHVSAMTVRRDLDELQAKGLVRRTHGGAVLHPGATVDPTFAQRSQTQAAVKQAIAAFAAGLIQPHDRLLLDSGSTIAALAEAMHHLHEAHVITHSLPVLHTLSRVTGMTLTATGGTYEPALEAFVGPGAEQTLADVRVDKAFLSATSVGLDDGFSNSHRQGLVIQREMLRVAREVYLLVDSSKFQRQPFWLVAPLRAVTAIVTDRSIPPTQVERLTAAGIRVLIAPMLLGAEYEQH